MAKSDKRPETGEITIGPRDILFACPACNKNLVVDEAAEGLIVDCPQCSTNVIVPPKNGTATIAKPTPPATPTPVSAPAPIPSVPDFATLRDRLGKLANQMKELVTQRTELNNKLAARINEINRDLVMLARMETSQQQVLGELNQIANQLASTTNTPSDKPADASTAPAVGRSRVNFGG